MAARRGSRNKGKVMKTISHIIGWARFMAAVISAKANPYDGVETILQGRSK